MRWLDGITDSMHLSSSKLGDSEGQGSLAFCSSWGHKESDTAEQLTHTHASEIIFTMILDNLPNLEDIL